MTSFLRYPEPVPMTAAAASRPRDASGRVLMPLRAEVKLPGGRGFRRYFTTWSEVTEWLSSDDFASVAPRRPLAHDRQPPARPRSRMTATALRANPRQLDTGGLDTPPFSPKGAPQ